MSKDVFYPKNLDIDSFSEIVGNQLGISNSIFKDYILSNLSIAISRDKNLKNSVDKLYLTNKNQYYNAAINSSSISHIILTQGTLEQEIEARKALGIIVVAETDHNLRNQLVNLLRRAYPVIFNAVKKHNKNELAKKYSQMDEFSKQLEARLDSSIYFYFSLYRSQEFVDHSFINSIVDDMNFFEFKSPITRIISKEIEFSKSELQRIKSLLKKEYGKLNTLEDIFQNDSNDVLELESILENIFIINKLDINHLFANSKFINIDEIILAYIKSGPENINIKLVMQSVVIGIFLKSLINEYKTSRNLYFENNQEILSSTINFLESSLSNLEKEKEDIINKADSLEKDKDTLNKLMLNQKNILNKEHKNEVLNLQNKIKELEIQLLSEKKYRNELNELREYFFKVNNNYIPSNSKKTLDYYIARTNILIIGGTKEWRRKFRDKYPEIRTLSGFNGTFDTTILSNYDYIFFYTGFMDHATYYRAINFIRVHNISFGYIGKTNIELVEDELIEELDKCIKN